eukprot:TRINITY_DN24848_c0_g1_i1.p1 TRINITY_DN24848_c0_g1~~TRINITY_DN24848_c0_g1_i1.p1  ORF type:complete len:121 (+),score=5.60 TRINITY_DN24848_c0_g1_i1:164-526(+)
MDGFLEIDNPQTTWSLWSKSTMQSLQFDSTECRLVLYTVSRNLQRQFITDCQDKRVVFCRQHFIIEKQIPLMAESWLTCVHCYLHNVGHMNFAVLQYRYLMHHLSVELDEVDRAKRGNLI